MPDRRNTQYVRCDVTSWSDQAAMFKAAIEGSPNKSCDVVVANAGVSGPDPVYNVSGTFIESNRNIKSKL
jgi:NAD(P)-dependent dehydrogenase (short-subunit alcohol dehydrogenase family)